ncbi:MAG: Lrp/AsnC family transcriptional regulator [Alphaproteobacteria bacterium]|jgi:siroheme decarboxylase|nr:Lrp/AsnC family transcriptional regulator [Alphaproteobacteria bacterium]
METSVIEQKLLNDYQRDFPLEPRPYARIARDLGISEEQVRDHLKTLNDRGAMSRIGAVVRPNTIGASTLAAIRVPPDRLDEVAAFVSAQPEVNHNYEREHPINLWFVVAAADDIAVSDVLARIETETGLEVIDLPLERSFHIDLGFDLEKTQP